ncbi:isopentenyl-diphosphate delta-isomerase type 1 [Brenneria salicis ATCC 15712 = DSM 30166]|uniref:Isopentenyl-diphosphate delta-isomerase type 1 n=1 Tax=Brenneria salicis ATCC 15712 = DSM 30166 TaxID=714314 RepID=A0A366HY88_9GAMM|nr:isopentenyl-diphosphate delta-isomerase type 1 [Brenneria salicis ATCC 15712 = DSM 30166]
MPLTEVILVDEADRPTGVMEKQEAHEKGLLHRAITVYVFNSRQQLLLQQRALDKYHSGGLWSNTCCSHHAPGEKTSQAGIVGCIRKWAALSANPHIYADLSISAGKWAY